VPLVFLVAALFLLGNYLVSETLKFAVDIGIIVLGVPIYALLRWFQRRAPPPAISVR
jgi:APA family basic amino acid/polyamine antiporter